MSDVLPSDFVSRVKEIYPREFEAVLASFERQKPSTFRVNTLKTTAEQLLTTLSAQGFELEQAPLSNAYILKNKSQRELTETAEYEEGFLYIQGLSSMIPPLVLDLHEGDLILDACSAPGSKTTQIASLVHNKGQIIANDMSKVRLYKLAANLKTLGVTNTTTTHFRAQELWKKFPNTFDATLVGVPCSLEGRFISTRPKTYAQWSVKKVKVLSEHQKHILRSAVSASKSGATIVYSTCTLSPEENEEVVDWMLSKDSSLTLIETTLPHVPTMRGLTEWNSKKYNPEVSKCMRIIPSPSFEGFFLAKFLKH